MNYFTKILPFIILTAVIAAFFLPLFFPVQSLFVTPDSYLSDLLHFHYPMKFLLSESLHHNVLPVWTDSVGTGFAPIGESQIHAFSLINLILFKYLPFVPAFNLQYVILFLMMAFGIYLVTREFNWSKVTGIFCGLIWTFSGLHIAIIPHINCLQALAYVPWILWILMRMQKYPSSIWLLLPLVCSQQILQGHYQYVFMTYIFFFLYGYIVWQTNKTIRVLPKWSTILLVSILTLGLAALQLVPSIEYFIQSEARSDLASNTLGSFQLNHLIQYIVPYWLGDIRIGTYPGSEYGIGFWETFASIGVVPLALAFFSLKDLRKRPWVRGCWITIAILFLFVFGKNSPLYVLFSIPPFSWFRVESRFLAFVDLLLVLLAGYTLNQWIRARANKLLIFLILGASMIEVFLFASSYHPTLPAAQVLQKPAMFEYISQNNRIASIPVTNGEWYHIMYTQGWKNTLPYLSMLNYGQPNYPLIHGIDNFMIYAGFLPQTQIRLMSMGLAGSYNEQEKTATLSAVAINTLKLTGTDTLLSAFTLHNKELTPVAKDRIENHTLTLYHLADTKPRYYLASAYKPVFYMETYIKALEDETALDRYDAFLTTNVPIQKGEQGTIISVYQTPVQKTLDIQTPSDTFLVTSLFRYPGWEAYLDGVKTPIIPANGSGMAVFIPKGTHTVRLSFHPISIFIGIAISGITALVYIYLIIRSVYRTTS